MEANRPRLFKMLLLINGNVDLIRLTAAGFGMGLTKGDTAASESLSHD